MYQCVQQRHMGYWRAVPAAWQGDAASPSAGPLTAHPEYQQTGTLLNCSVAVCV